jgi:CRISPR-associated endonuclease Cas1
MAADLSARLDRLRWHKLALTLVCTRAVPHRQEHALAVFEAIVKSVSARESAGKVVFRVKDRDCRAMRLEAGTQFRLEILFFGVESSRVADWLSALKAYLAEGERNFRLAGEETIETCGLPAAQTCPDDEACLEFLTPFSFGRAVPRGGVSAEQDEERERSLRKWRRTALSREQFLAALARRVEALFGLHLNLEHVAPALRVLPWFWEYIQFPHHSKSTRGTRQYLNGCIGRLYVRGAAPLFPLLRLCEEVNIGGSLAFGMGHFRLLTPAPPFFAHRLPDEEQLLRVIERVGARHEHAAEELAAEGVSALEPEALAKTLAEELRNGVYRPLPGRAILASGHGRAPRLFEELAFKDLAVQQALYDLLDPVIDRMLEPESVGFRKGCSRQLVAARIEALLQEGYRYAWRADVEDFFPSVDHGRLEALLRANLPLADAPVIDLVMLCVRAGFLYQGVEHVRARGLAQGAPLSSLLSNLYLDEFDEILQARGAKMVRYVDDILVLSRTREEAEDVERLAADVLHRLGLRFNAEKTAVHAVEAGFTFLGMSFGPDADSHAHAELTVAVEKPLYLVKPNLFLGVNGEALELRHYGKLEEVIPFRRISAIIVIGHAALSTAVVNKCVQYNIPITFTLSARGDRATTFAPDSREYYSLAARQAARYMSMTDVERLAIAKDIVAAKLRNYITLFKKRYRQGSAEIVNELERMAHEVHGAASLEAVRGMEGNAARMTFLRWATLIEEPAFRFERRERKRPDRINSLLNFGYYLLFARMNGTLRALGLNPYLGYLHDEGDRYESLTYDLMEPFRARVDHLLLSLIHWKTITAAHFEEKEDGQRLTREGIGLFVGQFETELVRKPKAGGLTLGEAIYAQCRNMQRFLCEERPLVLYCWRSEKDS